MTTETKWYVRLDNGTVQGPYRESQIRQGISRGKLVAPMRLRQGESGWIRVSRVKDLFAKLDQSGFYLRDRNNCISGPFTKTRLAALIQSKQLPADTQVRCGRKGVWTSAALPHQHAPAPSIRTKADVPAAPVMKLRSDSWLDYFQLWATNVFLPSTASANA